MATATKINLWPIISNILLIVCVVYIFTNVMSNKTLKTQMKVSQAKESVLSKQITAYQVKIDSLQSEIVRRDSLINDTKRWIVTLEQFKTKYEKTYNNIDTMSIDSNIKFFATETGN